MSRLLSLLLPAALLLLAGCSKQSRLERSLARKTGEVQLPAGAIDLTEPLMIDGASELTLRGAGQTVRMRFNGKAAIIIRNSKSVRLENFVLLGGRDLKDHRFGLPPSDRSMAAWNENNGILVANSEDVTLSKLTIRNVTSYPVLVSASKGVSIVDTLIGDSGSLDEKGLNNATGGILFEEGCDRFAVRNAKIRNVRGNGIWTHSLYGSPRNTNGEFTGNDIRYVGRDALQAGHASNLRISGNAGSFIGFPAEIVDVTRGAVPVAIDTAGNVDRSLYSNNHFQEVNGKCIDLDGFHHGRVEHNDCRNIRGPEAYPHGHYGIVLNNSNPDMESREIEIVSNAMEGFRFGGLFLIGEGHTVRGNEFRRINLARCNDNPAIGCVYNPKEPEILRSGIYFALGAHRPSPARNNVVEDNHVSGYRMREFCVVSAPGIPKSANTVRNNRCENDGPPPVAGPASIRPVAAMAR